MNQIASTNNGTSLEPERSPASTRGKQGSGWLRYLLQFSLRTLLIVTTVVAVACWWYLQPNTQYEPIGDTGIKVRRQVRTVRALDWQGNPVNSANPKDNFRTISDGSYRVLDSHDDLLIDGQMGADRWHGRWTIWHASGKKAAEGKLRKQARLGVWRTWHPDGTPASETSYEPVTGNKIKGVDMWPSHWAQTWRHGPARAWYPNGQLRLEGAYEEDARTGAWTQYDAQGRVIEQGVYVHNLREGEWRIRAKKSGELQSVNYLAGRTLVQQEQLLATLAADLQSGRRVRQLNAARKLEELGPAGVPLLEKAFLEGDDGLRLMALRALVRLDAVDDSLLPEVRGLMEHKDPGLALRAMLAVVTEARRHGSSDTATYRRLIEEVQSCSRPQLAAEVLHKLCKVDPEYRVEAFPLLVEALGQSMRRVSDLSNTGGSVALGVPAEDWDFYSLDVKPITSLEGDLSPLLVRAYSSPRPEDRLVVLRAVEVMVESQPPDTDAGGFVYRWNLPAQLRPLVEQAKADPNDVVRLQAENIGVNQWWARNLSSGLSGAGFSGGIGGFGPRGGRGGFF